MPQETLLRFKEILNEKRPGTSISELATYLDVSEPTARHYLEDRWTFIDRGILERFADLVHCKVGDLFSTMSSPFWDAFKEKGGSCHYLSHRLHAQIGDGTQREHRDDRALTLVANLVKDCAPDTLVYEANAATNEDFLRLVEKNLVVLGSPKSNPAAEYALSHIFSAEPLTPRQTAAPPFQFVWHPSMKVPESVFGRVSDPHNTSCGIHSRDHGIVLADYNPSETDFIRDRIVSGRDCAVVVVRNCIDRVSAAPRKLVVLAGFTKIGTEAAAHRLVADFREIEPRNGEPYVWGIVEAIYKKESGSAKAKVIHSEWRYRSGGRHPIDFKSRPIQMRGGLRARRQASEPLSPISRSTHGSAG